MLKEQLDAVSDQLMSDDNAEIRQKIFNAYQECGWTHDILTNLRP